MLIIYRWGVSKETNKGKWMATTVNNRKVHTIDTLGTMFMWVWLQLCVKVVIVTRGSLLAILPLFTTSKVVL